MPYHLYKGQTLPSRRQIERALKRIIQDQVDQVMHFELKEAHLIGRGVHRAAYLVDFQLKPDPIQFKGQMVLLYPYAEAATELKDRLLNEVCVLQSLSLDQPAFRSPYLIGHCIINDSVVILEEWIDGVQIDLRAGRCMVGKPWEVAGEVAARVHDLRQVGMTVGGFKTREEHALHSLQDLDGHDIKLFSEAKEWCLKYLPPTQPTTLLHGDLSGQNIMIDLEGKVAPALIDWTFTIQGDPAHELAIITQGKRRPFEVDYGHEKLIEAYEDAGGEDIRVQEIHLYEICLLGRRYRAAKNKKDRIESPQEPLRLLHHLMIRLKRK
jgi:hypothetical protein